MSVQLVVFFCCALIALFGAGGVVFSRNPVHSALSLVATLFAIAVLFLNQNAQFLAAVQVIVYTGAIVILILFVIMLLGVDRFEDLTEEPLGLGFRTAGLIASAALAVVLLAVLFTGQANIVTGKPDVASQAIGGHNPYQPISSKVELLCGSTPPPKCNVPSDPTDPNSPPVNVIDNADNPNINLLGRQLFTQYVLVFEVTAALLTIAVVGAVVLAKRVRGTQPIPGESESLESGAHVSEIDAAGDAR